MGRRRSAANSHAGAPVTAHAGVEKLDLHHLYRAMAWLGEELPEKEQDARTPFAAEAAAPKKAKLAVLWRSVLHRRWIGHVSNA
jgi:hypothetical protein